MADWAEERAGELAARLVPRDKYYWDVVAAFARELRAAHAAGRAEGEREHDIYRAALAVVISDLGGEVTVSARALTEAPELAETEWATTDESFTEGQDVTFQIVVK